MISEEIVKEKRVELSQIIGPKLPKLALKPNVLIEEKRKIVDLRGS